MSQKQSYRYKGLALFGAPGSGKTTMANILIKVFPNAQSLEAANSVIYPALTFQKNLPSKEADFFKKVARIGSLSSEGIIREDARNFAQELIKKYSEEIIAKTLSYIHDKKYPDKLMILSGSRGYKNAVYLKKAGYMIIYLKTQDEHSIARVVKRESSSVELARQEREVEERLFQTSKIETIADLSIGTYHEKEEEFVEKIRTNLIEK